MTLNIDFDRRPAVPAVPLAAVRSGSAPHGRQWRNLALFTLLAAVSGAASVLVLHRSSSFDPAAIETGALPGSPVRRPVAASLARSVLTRLDDANRTGNYDVFRSVAAPGFQQINSAADLARIFAWLRRDGVRLDVSTGLVERTIRVAAVEPRGHLRLVGEVATPAGPINFDLMLQDVAGDWQLLGVAIYRE